MARYKKENANNYRQGECIRCGMTTTRRNSWAIHLDSKAKAALVLARDKEGQPITLKAGPRIHRETCEGSN